MGVCLGLRAAVAATNAPGVVNTPPSVVGQPGAVGEEFETGLARVLALQQAAEFKEAIQLGTILEAAHRNHPGVGDSAPSQGCPQRLG